MRSRPNALAAACLAALCSLFASPSVAQTAASPPSVETVQYRAFEFFWHETSAETGLTKDRATNLITTPDRHTVASIAATGYALAALPIGIEHGWVSKQAAYARALITLRFVHDRLYQVHGFYYHFVDERTGERVWKCELSSCDTALLVLGALAAGQYWPHTPVARLADDIAERVDWPWMVNEGGTTPDELAPCLGWRPETGWINARWVGYSEGMYIYLLGLGSLRHSLRTTAWTAWVFPLVREEGLPVFDGPSPLFMAQMAAGFFDLRDSTDLQHRNWWTAWRNAHLADQAYSARHPKFATYAAGFWGITASDEPGGYGAEAPADGRNDGTVAPTAMLAAVAFTPQPAQDALANLWTLHSRLWGRYGFSDAFNVGRNWYDRDVIGIDLGMMLVSTENARSGLIWRLMRSNPAIIRGLAAAGFSAAPPKTENSVR